MLLYVKRNSGNVELLPMAGNRGHLPLPHPAVLTFYRQSRGEHESGGQGSTFFARGAGSVDWGEVVEVENMISTGRASARVLCAWGVLESGILSSSGPSIACPRKVGGGGQEERGQCCLVVLTSTDFFAHKGSWSTSTRYGIVKRVCLNLQGRWNEFAGSLD